MSASPRYEDCKDSLLKELRTNGGSVNAASIKLKIDRRSARRWRDKLIEEGRYKPTQAPTIRPPKSKISVKAKPVAKKVYDNRRILFISDMHIPYHHKNTVAFLTALKKKYRPTRIICLGDEVDKHALSFHAHDPDLMSAGDELTAAKPVIAQIHKLFPEMDLISSNHGSLVYRKAKEHGIPRSYIRSYNDVLGVGPGWVWHDELIIDLPDGQQVYIHHGKSADAIKTSQAMSMSHVCGHYHNSFAIKYWANPTGLFFAINGGCLIDDKSLAFAYNNANLHRPIIGTPLIIDGKPILEEMPL